MIKEFISHIGLDKTLDYIIEVIDLFINPKKFFNNFSSKDLKEKLKQTIVYLIIVLSLAYAIAGDEIKNEINNICYYAILNSIATVLILILSEAIISRITKKKTRYQDFIFFVIIVKLFYGPISLILYSEFITTENYNWLFWYNVFVVCMVIYIYYYSAYLFHSKTRYIILNIVLNLIFLQSYHFVKDYLKVDKYCGNIFYSDKIAKERFDKGKDISEFLVIPTHKIFDVKTEEYVSYYLLHGPNDSISYGNSLRTEEYKKNIRQNVLILDTLKSKFRRNSRFFNNLKELCVKTEILMSNVDSLNLMVISSPEEMKDLTPYMDENNTLYLKRVYDLDREALMSEINGLRDKLVREQIEFNNLNSNVILPKIILKYIYNFRITLNHQTHHDKKD